MPRFRILCFPVLIGWLAISSNHVAAQDPFYYEFYPSSVMKLGYGFYPTDLRQPTVSALDFTVEQEKGALSTTFEKVLVRNNSQLKKALHIDARVDAHYLVFHGGATFTYDESSIFTADSITMVVEATTEYGRRFLKDQKLTKDAKALIDAGKMDEFEQAHGSDVVVIERRGARVAAIVTLFEVSDESKQNIATQMQAGGGWGPLSAKAEAAIQKELARASLTGQLRVQVVATGGEGLGGLAGIIEGHLGKPDALEKTTEALSHYLKGFNLETSAPIGFHAKSMKAFGWKPSGKNLLSASVERRLTDIVRLHRQGTATLEQIKGLLDQDDADNSQLKADQVKILKSAVPIYEKYLDKLADAHAACMQQQKVVEIPDEPKIPEDLQPKNRKAAERRAKIHKAVAELIDHSRAKREGDIDPILKSFVAQIKALRGEAQAARELVDILREPTDLKKQVAGGIWVQKQKEKNAALRGLWRIGPPHAKDAIKVVEDLVNEKDHLKRQGDVFCHLAMNFLDEAYGW